VQDVTGFSMEAGCMQKFSFKIIILYEIVRKKVLNGEIDIYFAGCCNLGCASTINSRTVSKSKDEIGVAIKLLVDNVSRK